MALIRRFGFLFMAGWLATLGSSAGAETITYAKFYSGGSGYTGPFSAGGTVYDATKGLGTDCPSSGGCGPADNVSSPMIFAGKGITATAGPSGNLPWGDFSPNFGGLGVGTGSPSDSDQVGSLTDVLTLTFSGSVRLTGVGTLFDPGHTPFGGGFPNPSDVAGASGIAFLLSVDGGTFDPVTFALANTMSLSLLGTTFSFMQEAGNPEFYVSALSYGSCGPVGASCAPPPQTPLPAALPLFATGLAGLGWLACRRRKQAA
jgi:hypothetical protein